MKFSSEFIDGLLQKDIVLDEIIEKRRWYIRNRMIFTHEDKFYECLYDVPATECQELDHPNEYECKEVHPKAKVVTVYE
jgi:hypothetical protein